MNESESEKVDTEPPKPSVDDHEDTKDITNETAEEAKSPSEEDKEESLNNKNGMTKEEMNSAMQETNKMLKDKVMGYSVCKDTGSNLGKNRPHDCNILLIGPTGVGKSSFIKSVSYALYEADIHKELQNLPIHNGVENEGTKRFTTIRIKPEFTPGNDERDDYDGIVFQDTRGQIFFDNYENQQVSLLIKGGLKNNSEIEQVQELSYIKHLLYWIKGDQYLFPDDIYEAKKTLNNRPHTLVFVFDGSAEKVPNGEDETDFYSKIISEVRNKGKLFKNLGYGKPQIILTKKDLYKESLIKSGKLEEEYDIEQFRFLIKEREALVASNLGVDAENVHFITNYHKIGKETIEYEEDDEIVNDVLSVVFNCLMAGDEYIEGHVEPESRCVLQ